MSDSEIPVEILARRNPLMEGVRGFISGFLFNVGLFGALNVAGTKMINRSGWREALHEHVHQGGLKVDMIWGVALGAIEAVFSYSQTKTAKAAAEKASVQKDEQMLEIHRLLGHPLHGRALSHQVVAASHEGQLDAAAQLDPSRQA